MHYYIDGYNMLFRHSLLRQLKAERESLLKELYEKISYLNFDVSIVFDATFQAGSRAKSHLDNLEILYSAGGETADQYIVDIVSREKHPRRLTIVTNDRSLASQVRYYGAKVESVEVFMQKLNQSYRKKLIDPTKSREKKLENTFVAKVKPKDALPPLLPAKNMLEHDADYYQRVFEAHYQIMEKERNEIRSLKKAVKKVRHPKKTKSPFEETQVIPKNESDELDRWLEVFENRNNYPKDIFDLEE